jgi:prepilin-type N-terminal cleavage/methylation domain-containing protein
MIKNLVSKPGISGKVYSMGSQGFTLIELLITMAVITVLAGVAVTAYVGSTLKAARSEAYANLESVRLLEERFRADNGIYTGDLGVTRDATCLTGAQAEANVTNGVSGIQTDLPLFRPGNDAQFCYYILANEDITGAGQTPCFTAVANGLTGTRVEGDIFSIDCNNDRTF